MCQIFRKKCCQTLIYSPFVQTSQIWLSTTGMVGWKDISRLDGPMQILGNSEPQNGIVQHKKSLWNACGK